MKKILLALLFLFLCSVASAQLPPLGISDSGGTEAKPVFTFDCAGIGLDCTHSGIMGTATIGAELYTKTKCIIIETPTSADNFLMYHVELGMQVTAIHCIVEDATSATIDFEQCDVAGDNCTDIVNDPIVCDVGGQADDGTIDNPDLDVDDWVRLDVTATSGTPGHVTACFTATMDD